MTCKILTTQQPLSFRQALTLLANINVSYQKCYESDFVTLVQRPYNRPLPSPEEICELIAQQNFKSLANDIKRSDRQDRKGKRSRRQKMSSWSLVQRRGLLSGQHRYLKAQTTFQELYWYFYQEIQTLDIQYPKKTRGPDQIYDRTALTAAIMLKMLHDIEWFDLPSRLRGEKLDLRLPSKKDSKHNPVPSHQTFFTLFKQLSSEELDNVLVETDTRCQNRLTTWSDKTLPLIYAADGSGHPLQTEEPYIFKGKPSSRRKSTHLVLLQNLQTRTIRGLFYPEITGQSRKDLRGFMQRLPPGAILLGDREFDVEYLQKTAQKTHIDLQVRPNLRNGKVARTPLRRKAHRKFNPKLYRLRKTNEAIFSILAKRGILVPRRTSVPLAAKAALWACAAHNFDCLFNLDVSEKIFKWVAFPLDSRMLRYTQKNTQLGFLKYPGDLGLIGEVNSVSELKLTPVNFQDPTSDRTLKRNLKATKVDSLPQKVSNNFSKSSDLIALEIVSPSHWCRYLQRLHQLSFEQTAWMIFGFLIQCAPHVKDRTQICQALGLPRTTIYDNLQCLIREGFIIPESQSLTRRGRPKTIYCLSYPASDRGPPS